MVRISGFGKVKCYGATTKRNDVNVRFQMAPFGHRSTAMVALPSTGALARLDSCLRSGPAHPWQLADEPVNCEVWQAPRADLSKLRKGKTASSAPNRFPFDV